jgi:hypothetical protein
VKSFDPLVPFWKLSPVVWLSVAVPLVERTLTSIWALAASASEVETRLPLALLKTSAVFSLVV